MKTEEDEAFEAIERRQGGFQAKRAMAADKLQEPEREALKLALEALEHISKFGCNHVRGVCTCEYREAADAIKAALAQPAQEYVCDKDPQGCWNVRCQLGKQCKNLAQPAQEPVALVIDGVLVKSALPEKYTGHLYTAPPQRPWVGLTDEEIDEGNKQSWVTKQAWESAVWWASEKLKEKNNGT